MPVSELPQAHGACASCALFNAANLERLGVAPGNCDYVVGLAGNPNTGKSTVFNALTGLRQHVGNWAGKTVTRAEGAFAYGGHRYLLVDLPGVYSLLSSSQDEEIAREFLLFGQPDVTVVVADATRLERNLNLVLQVLETTERVVVAVNLMDEADRHGIQIDERHLARELGVPVVPTSARGGKGIPELLEAIEQVAEGAIASRRHRVEQHDRQLEAAVRDLSGQLDRAYPGLPNTRWVALRLLEGDSSVERALQDGTFDGLARGATARANALGGAFGGETA